MTESILQKYKVGSFIIGNRLNFYQNGCLFYLQKIVRNDCDENNEAPFSDNKKLKTDRNKKDGG